MPTYEYQCDDCGIRFELRQSIKEDPIEICPECKGHVRRLIGKGAAVIFRGSGFHANDYGDTNSSCSRDTPCCGRSTPCDKKPCEE